MDQNDPDSQLEEYKKRYKDETRENRALKKEIRELKSVGRKLEKEVLELEEEIPTVAYEGYDGEYVSFDDRSGVSKWYKHKMGENRGLTMEDQFIQKLLRSK
jgi:hypothetical protein